MNSVADIAANIKQMTDLGEQGGRAGKARHAGHAGGLELVRRQQGRKIRQCRRQARRQVLFGSAGAGEEAQGLGACRLADREGSGGKVSNVTYVFNRDGKEVARYCKIHMFDITAPDGARYEESAAVLPGREIVTYDCEGITVGCAICYDLRFPELFQALADARRDR